ncbi:MAG: hypothetical protein ACR2JY_17730 [Chloroflexota bacterium]
MSTVTPFSAASDREVLLLMSQQIDVLRKAIDTITNSQDRSGEDMASLRDRLDQLSALTRYLVTALLFVITPIYGAAVWTLVVHLVGGGK